MKTLHGITKKGERMMFNFDSMEWTAVPATPTKSNRWDGTIMARVAAEVNAQCIGYDFVALQCVTY